MFGTPIAWLAGGAVVAIGLFFGAVQIRHAAKLDVVRSEGIAIGKAGAATAALESATETTKAIETAKAETPLLTVPAEIIEACKREASCKERHALQ
jgi:hypothetical protein